MRYQNLNDEKMFLEHGRCWLGNFCFEWVIPSRLFGIKVGLGNYDHALSFSLELGILSLYVSYDDYKLESWVRDKVKRKDQKYGNGRIIGLSFHDGAMWVDLWIDPMEGRSNDPWWWSFSFNPVNLIFGKEDVSFETLEENDIEIPMPEKSYKAKAILSMVKVARKRWFPKYFKRVEIDIEEGIPHEGKGTMPYNCGTDYTYSFTTPARTIADGVGKLVGSVLNDRVKNGGWKDWSYKSVPT